MKAPSLKLSIYDFEHLGHAQMREDGRVLDDTATGNGTGRALRADRFARASASMLFAWSKCFKCGEAFRREAGHQCV